MNAYAVRVVKWSFKLLNAKTLINGFANFKNFYLLAGFFLELRRREGALLGGSLKFREFCVICKCKIALICGINGVRKNNLGMLPLLTTGVLKCVQATISTYPIRTRYLCENFYIDNFNSIGK